jgi:hypothetical protein
MPENHNPLRAEKKKLTATLQRNNAGVFPDEKRPRLKEPGAQKF